MAFEDGDLVPGTDDGDLGDPSSAETENTDRGAPGPVPYHRFKEVNDSLRGYKEIGSAEDFHRLMQWEQTFAEDPAGWWMQFSASIDGLPDPVRQAIDAYNRGETVMTPQQTPNPAPSGTGPEESELPAWASDLVEKVQSLSEDASKRQQKEAEAQREELLNSMHDLWLQQDKEAKVKSPNIKVRAALLAAAAAAPNISSREEAVALARAAWEEERKGLVDEALEAGKTGQGAPKSVPGSGSGGGNLPEPPKTLEEAKKATLAFYMNN